jgi:hypothetical protein
LHRGLRGDPSDLLGPALLELDVALDLGRDVEQRAQVGVALDDLRVVDGLARSSLATCGEVANALDGDLLGAVPRTSQRLAARLADGQRVDGLVGVVAGEDLVEDRSHRRRVEVLWLQGGRDDLGGDLRRGEHLADDGLLGLRAERDRSVHDSDSGSCTPNTGRPVVG